MSAIGSLILSAASILSLDCKAVFLESVAQYHLIRKHALSAEERVLMDGFAKVACQTSNPDVLWKMAATESSLTPMIARDNISGRIFRGKPAVEVAFRALQSKDNNIDIGILQINVKSHGRAMMQRGLNPFNPEAQITYIIDSMMPALTKRCGETNWVGCYHSWQSRARAKKYQDLVQGQHKHLAKALVRVARARADEKPNP